MLVCSLQVSYGKEGRVLPPYCLLLSSGEIPRSFFTFTEEKFSHFGEIPVQKVDPVPYRPHPALAETSKGQPLKLLENRKDGTWEPVICSKGDRLTDLKSIV